MNSQTPVDDEMLMAYADGELEVAARLAIEAAMAADPKVAARVAQHSALRRRVHSTFAPVLEEPVPDRLIEWLRAVPEATPTARVVALDERRGMAAAVGNRRRWSWPEWGAMAASLVVGIVISQRLMPSSEPIVARNGDLYAQGFLAAALSELLASTLPVGGAVQPGISFRNQDGDYCRTFQMTATAPVAGLACRDDEGWRLLVLTETEAPAAAENYRMAAATLPPSIRSSVERIINGDPLDAEAEDLAKGRGWR